MNHRFNYFVSLLFMLPLQVFSQQADKPPEQDDSFIGLLEFLGEFETPAGDWLSPSELAQDDSLNVVIVSETQSETQSGTTDDDEEND